jgi:uncharacterized protein YjbI with pentapeptide repeats
MKDIKSVNEFIEAYKSGLRQFTNLEFEHGESFSGMNLSGATFKGCWFCVDFTKSNLTACKFIDCNLKTTDFSHANLTAAQIKDCSIDSTEFKGTIIQDFIFEDNSAYGNTLNLNDFKRIFGFDK